MELLLTSGMITDEDGITITLRYSALIASKVADLTGADGILLDGSPVAMDQVTISENVITVMPIEEC